MSLEMMNISIGQPLILALVIPFMIAFMAYLRMSGSMNRKKWVFYLTRSLYAFLLLAALSGPSMVSESEKFQDVTALTILSDRSGSMGVYQNDTGEFARNLYTDLAVMLKNITGFNSIYFKEFSEGNNTGIGDALYQNSVESNKESNLLVLVSDGNNNYGRDARDVAKVVGATGSRILSVAPVEPKDEVYILGISGDKKTPVYAKYTFTVDVGKLGKEAKYSLRVAIDGKEISSSSNLKQQGSLKYYNYTQSFETTGIHVITASISSEYSQFAGFNDVFSKTVDVVDKPKVLVVTDRQSPLLEILEDSYEVQLANTVPGDLAKYVCVYLDNKNATQIPNDAVSALNQYVIDGNGLVVVGGDKAYEKGGYASKPTLEAMLPVKSEKEPVKKRKEMAVVILMDISDSTAYGYKSDAKIQQEKDVTANILKNSLDPKDYVGLVVYNGETFTIAEIGRLAEKEDLQDNIYRLQFGGGTDILPALDRAEQMLSNYPQDKYVIIVSDGVLGTYSYSRGLLAQEKVSKLSENGIKTYTVGFGFDSDKIFLNKLAEAGRGKFYMMEQDQRLKMEFSQSEEDSDKKIYDLKVSNDNHFITESIQLPATSIKNYNDVTAKSISQVLVTTEGNKPVVTVWRYGLGRVAAITTDNGAQWSNDLYIVQSGKIVSAVTNWVIGDLEKTKPVLIETQDVTLGREAEIYLKSDSAPKLTVTGKAGNSLNITLKQTDVGLYSGRFKPESAGFYSLKALNNKGSDVDGISVNYPLEYSRLGTNNEDLVYIASVTDGKSYNQTQAKLLEADIFDYIKMGTMKKTADRMPLEAYALGLVVVLFFIDTVARRIMEIKRLQSGR